MTSLLMFGIYFHIPYCIQRCSYCDFATYKKDEILPPSDYLELVKKEIVERARFIPHRDVDTVYYGGGTPSLLDPKDILAMLTTLANSGFRLAKDCEITLEANPGTIDESKLVGYLKSGVNRISVGAQTFDAALLKSVGRFHTVQDTERTLALLKKHNLNFSLDVLFALPKQSPEMLERDVARALEFSPPHVSPYCLTLPKAHPLQQNRPSDESQVKMFELVDKMLCENGLFPYEISNYSRPGLACKHNQIYWTDQDYWGIGLSSHSYLKIGDWGLRFWNPSTIEQYAKKIAEGSTDWVSLKDGLGQGSSEALKKHESLSDFCYTSLRTGDGLSEGALRCKYGVESLNLMREKLQPLARQGLVNCQNETWTLTKSGKLISNFVFEKVHVTESGLRP